MVDSNSLQHLSLLPFVVTVLLFEVFIVLSQRSLHVGNGSGLLFQSLEFITEILVLILEFLYLLMDLLDLDVILNTALQFLELVHQIDLRLLLQLQDAADVLLLGVLLHDQEQHQLHQLRHVFALEQLLPVGSLDPQVLHFHQVFLNLDDVALVVELLINQLREIRSVDASKQEGQQTRLSEFSQGEQLDALANEASLTIDPHQQLLRILRFVVITHFIDIIRHSSQQITITRKGSSHNISQTDNLAISLPIYP